MIRVSIFEDSKHLRETFEMLINASSDIKCSGAYSHGNDVLEELKKSPCEVVLMDIEMPGINGIEATRKIKEKYPNIQILIQTVFFEDQYIFDAICSGASGYILKSSSPQEYLEAISEVDKGGSPMSPGIARKVLELFRTNVESKSPTENRYNLSEKEKRVLQLLVSGKSYKMIAAELGIAFDTVKSHIRNIYTKLHVNSGTEAVALALKDRLV